MRLSRLQVFLPTQILHKDMKRLAKFQNPRMISARVERSDAEKFESILGQQPHLTLQDFLCYSIKLFISGNIKANGKDFVLKNDR